MSKYYEELLKLASKDEAKVKKLLMKNYVSSIADIKKILKEYIISYEDLTYAQQLESQRLNSLLTQMEDNLKKLYDNNYEAIKDYDLKTFEREYFGIFYEVENVAGINLSFAMLNKDYIQQAIEFPIDGLKLSERLYDKHLMDMKLRVKGAVTQGLISSSGYAPIAKTISDIGWTNFNHALVIAITEAGRMKSLARQQGQEEAVKKGVKLQKKWVSTLDLKTRSSHQKLDGQTVPIDGEFEINGHRAPQPRLFGVAKEDIHCRCDTITVVEGVSPEFRRDNETKEIIKYRNYDEWYNEKVKKLGKEEVEVLEKKKKNESSDRKQHKKYKEILGAEIPEFFADFQDLKYNDSKGWNTMKDYYKARVKGNISAFSTYEDYKTCKLNIEDRLVSITTSNGIEIKSYSKHFIDRVLGTSNDPKTNKPRSGVEIEDIKNALIKPLKIKEELKKSSHKFIGERATVSINPNTGNLVQCNPTDNDLVRRLKNV